MWVRRMKMNLLKVLLRVDCTHPTRSHARRLFTSYSRVTCSPAQTVRLIVNESYKPNHLLQPTLTFWQVSDSHKDLTYRLKTLLAVTLVNYLQITSRNMLALSPTPSHPNRNNETCNIIFNTNIGSAKI